MRKTAVKAFLILFLGVVFLSGCCCCNTQGYSRPSSCSAYECSGRDTGADNSPLATVDNWIKKNLW